MVLGKVDFTQATNAFPVIKVPEGETLDVEGISKSWEPVDNRAGDGQHVLAKYIVEHEIDGKQRNVELRIRWTLKPDGLWRTKRDLVKLGVDPTDLNSKSVDLEKILNDLFRTPHRATIRVKEVTYTPAGFDPDDESSPQPRQQNEVVAIKKFDADW